MELAFEVGSVAAITVICWLIGLCIKASPLDDKWIPCIVGIFGGLVGLLGWRVMPDFPATEPVTALAVGIVSGLASTGAHQVYKQLLPPVSTEGEQLTGTVTGHLDKAQLEALDFNNLKRLAASLGVNTNNLKRDEVVAAVAALEIAICLDETEGGSNNG